jgi:hypothetical protein
MNIEMEMEMDGVVMSRWEETNGSGRQALLYPKSVEKRGF